MRSNSIGNVMFIEGFNCSVLKQRGELKITVACFDFASLIDVSLFV